MLQGAFGIAPHTISQQIHYFSLLVCVLTLWHATSHGHLLVPLVYGTEIDCFANFTDFQFGNAILNEISHHNGSHFTLNSLAPITLRGFYEWKKLREMKFCRKNFFLLCFLIFFLCFERTRDSLPIHVCAVLFDE